MNMDVQIDVLTKNFAIDGRAQIISGKGGLPNLEIHSSRATALISLLGGQVLSFIPEGERDLLFVSDKAYYQEGKATKGGTPICWPCFGAYGSEAGLPFHGFVRNRLWQLESVQEDSAGDVIVSLIFEDNDETRAIWPYAFCLRQIIRISDRLHIELQTQNSGEQPFELTQAIHTYFRVSDINTVQVNGLDGRLYLDKVRDLSESRQVGAVRFSGETDRIYQAVDYPLEIIDEGWKRRIIIESGGSKTAVVWNPWADISSKSADLAENDYQIFVCVETANAADDVIIIPPGEKYSLYAGYQIQSDQ